MKKKEENNKLSILNDKLDKEKQKTEEEFNEYKNELNEYKNELYRANNTHSQKMIELSNELEQKIKNLKVEKKTRRKITYCRK